MVKRKTPRPFEFKVLVDGKPLPVWGYESTAALGIAKVHDDNYASVMLLNGAVLMAGFTSIDEAHAFNCEVSATKKLKPGSSNLHDFYASAGGLAAAKLMLEKIRKKVQQEPKK